MTAPWDALPYLQNFFQLTFLFSGLEVSSTMVFGARLAVFLMLGTGGLWFIFKIVTKILDCLQTLFASLAPVPRIFYLLLFLVIPLWPDSLGAKWIGYILLVSAILGVAMLGILGLVLWKYGVDQTLRLINTFRSRSEKSERQPRETPWDRGHTLKPVPGAPLFKTESEPGPRPK